MNKSRQRDVVLEVLRSTKSHPTVDWIYQHAKAIIPTISLATVYRNVEQLKESGEIIEIYGGFEKSRFDGNPLRHVHLICRQCGAVVDIEVERQLDSLIFNQHVDSQIDDYILSYIGVCNSCISKTMVKEA